MQGDGPSLTADLVLRGYSLGVFPMAEHRDDPEIFWVEPKLRGVLPLDTFHISRSLAKALRRADYAVTFDQDFAGVIDGCADRAETWINGPLRGIYLDFHHNGVAHSVEVWRDGALIGGSYGVSLGAAWFGESMFSRATNASKIALAFLVDRLRLGGYALFDTQFLTPHLASLGAIEISRARYQQVLTKALNAQGNFDSVLGVPAAQDVIQRNIQTS